VGYLLALLSYALGLGLSAVVDLPSSAMVVWTMALVGLVVHIAHRGGAAAATAAVRPE
jgi:ABC-type Mn2+/Zn2+ transport system permease subunit